MTGTSPETVSTGEEGNIVIVGLGGPFGSGPGAFPNAGPYIAGLHNAQLPTDSACGCGRPAGANPNRIAQQLQFTVPGLGKEVILEVNGRQSDLLSLIDLKRLARRLANAERDGYDLTHWCKAVAGTHSRRRLLSQVKLSLV